MTEVRVSEALLQNLDKEIVLISYDYEKDEAKYMGDKIKLWNFIVMMYIISKKITPEKMIEKLENIIKQPKILVVFVKSLKKILYIWLKDYDLHCRFMIKLCPDIYNPKRILALYGDKSYRIGDNSDF